MTVRCVDCGLPITDERAAAGFLYCELCEEAALALFLGEDDDLEDEGWEEEGDDLTGGPG